MIPYIQPSTGMCYVNYVVDGDTFKCDGFKLRLCGIDAPEKAQVYGGLATAKLTQLTMNKNVRVVFNAFDVYGRVLGEVWIDDRLINAEMVRAGLAYKYGSCPVERL